MDVRQIALQDLLQEILVSSIAQEGFINAMATDGQLLFSVDFAGRLMIWSMDTLEHLRTTTIGTEGLLSIILDDDYVYIGSSYIDGHVSVWRKEDLSPVIALKDGQGSVLSLCDTGTEVVAARSSGTIDFFSKSDWMKIASLDSQHQLATVLSVDDDFIYVGGINDYVTVFKLSNHSPVTRLEGHDADIFSICIDGDYLLSGSGEIGWGGPGSPRPPSFESAIRMWKRGTWEFVRLLEGHTDNINSIATDEHNIYSISDDGTLCSYSKTDWSQTKLTISKRPLKSMVLHDRYLYICNNEGHILRIPTNIFND